MKRTILLFFCMTAILVMDACTYKREVIIPVIDPANAIALSGVIVFTGDTKQVPGSLPSSPGTPACTNANTTILNNPSIKLTNGSSSVFLPIQFSGTTPISMVYVQVRGADTYFQVPIASPVVSGVINIPISLPSSVIDGKFTLQIVLAGTNGCIAGRSILTVPVEVGQPLACNTPAINGNAGITQNVHNLNRVKGKITIDYETYSQPDRIDVYLDGKWIVGTGSQIAPPPPLSSCSNPLPGFIGTNGERRFTFDVDASNRQVQVYISGCVDGTAWYYRLTCQ